VAGGGWPFGLVGSNAAWGAGVECLLSGGPVSWIVKPVSRCSR